MKMLLKPIVTSTTNGVFQFPFYSIPSPHIRKRSNSIIAQATPSRTERIMKSIAVSGEVGGAGGAYSYNALKRLDQLWSDICSASQAVTQVPRQVVSTVSGSYKDSELGGKSLEMFDVVVCGGTLGIFIATALSSKGLQVGIVERNVLKGRDQEWNISRKELLELVEAGILTEDDIERAVAASYNPNRCGFEGRGDIWVNDILNLGISPSKLVQIMKERFDSLGGVTFEGCSVSTINVYEDGVDSPSMADQGNNDGSVQASSERTVSDFVSPPAFHTGSLSSAHHYVSIKLTNDNFLFWRTQLTPFLRGQSLLGFVDGTFPCPTAEVATASPTAAAPVAASTADSEAASAAAATARAAWLCQDQVVLSLLISSLSEETLPLAIGRSTSRQLWLVIEQTLGSSTRARILRLLSQLQSLRQGGSSISDYLGRARILVEGLALAGHAVSPNDQNLCV